MLPFFRAYLEQFDALHGLPGEALDWIPGPEMNSLTMLVTHMTGSERYWLGEVGGGDPMQRDRGSEFRARGIDISALTARLDANEAYARRMLESLALAA